MRITYPKIGEEEEDTFDDTSSTSALVNEESCKATLSAMLEQERHYMSNPYLTLKVEKGKKSGGRKLSESILGIDIDVSCRSRVCKWIFQVIKTTRMHETAGIAISYLDRFMSVSSGHSRRRTRYHRPKYQLIALTCLYLAIKIHEQVSLSLDMICSISRENTPEMSSYHVSRSS